MTITTSGAILSPFDDEPFLAEWAGWTAISTRDAIVFTGVPPEDEMRYLGWRRKGKARQGELELPCYFRDHAHVMSLERKLRAEGKGAEYLKNLRRICRVAPSNHYEGMGLKSGEELELSVATANCATKCAAVLLTLGREPENKDWEEKCETMTRHFQNPRARRE